MHFPRCDISPNISFVEDTGFGTFHRDVVFPLLQLVDVCFSSVLDRRPFSSPCCMVLYNHTEDNPKCCSGDGCRLIYLHVSGDYWCKWVYQFAHEYCHHLIGGAFTGDVLGLTWFEETVCELSSMYHLYQMFRFLSGFPEGSIQHRYAPSVRDYLNDLLNEQPALYARTLSPGFLTAWDSLLGEPRYHRGHYNAIATRMYPLFLENPRLWRIILHFGDMRRWGSLGELFGHLLREAEPDYVESLSRLRSLLLA